MTSRDNSRLRVNERVCASGSDASRNAGRVLAASIDLDSMRKLRHTIAWFIAFAGATGCSLNPQIDPPSAQGARANDGGFVPVEGTGGAANSGVNAVVGGTSSAGSGNGGSPNGSPMSGRDGGRVFDAGADKAHDGAAKDAGDAQDGDAGK